MISTMWVKFDGMDIECICDEHRRKCDSKEGSCKKYIVKFIEVKPDPIDAIDASAKELDGSIRKLNSEFRNIKRLGAEFKRSINKFKI